MRTLNIVFVATIIAFSFLVASSYGADVAKNRDCRFSKNS